MAILPTLYLRENSNGLYQLVIYSDLCSSLDCGKFCLLSYYEEIDNDNTFGPSFKDEIYLEKSAR